MLRAGGASRRARGRRDRTPRRARVADPQMDVADPQSTRRAVIARGFRHLAQDVVDVERVGGDLERIAGPLQVSAGRS